MIMIVGFVLLVVVIVAIVATGLLEERRMKRRGYFRGTAEECRKRDGIYTSPDGKYWKRADMTMPPEQIPPPPPPPPRP